MAKRLTVHRDSVPIYDIVLEDSFEQLKKEMESLGVSGKKLCIVSDSNVAKLYLKEVETLLKSCCKKTEHFIFPAGEEHKNLDTVRDLYEVLIQGGFDRGDMLVALGGGVTGDLCGFAAATYLRGISFVQIPTTLLAQVDSSIGGKTGVDFDSYKNMVGAFHMPRLVYTNIRTLQSLPKEQFASGMGEIIKHGLIKDKAYYRWLKENASEIQKRTPAVCEEMVFVSNQIKKAVVEMDPLEKGDRALLNFGHTLGHAIEKLKNFSMLHGHCVAAGSLGAAAISRNRGMISGEELEEIKEVTASFGLPVQVTGLSTEDIIDATKKDKKMDGDVIKFILLKETGSAYVDRTVGAEEMAAGLEYILK